MQDLVVVVNLNGSACRMMAQKLRAETTYKVTTRYFPNIATDMKILHGLKVLDIISVLNIDERKSELQIIAKERDRNGEESS